MNRYDRLFSAAVGLAIAAQAIAPSVASARSFIFQLPGQQRAFTNGSYRFPCTTPVFFPGSVVGDPGPVPKFLQYPPPNNVYFSGIILSPGGCPGNGVRMLSFLLAQNLADPDTVSATTFVFNAGQASLASKLPGTQATTPDTLQDSLRVVVNRGTPGQLTLSISGVARHLNPAAAPAPGAMSRLALTVYPDSNSAKNETGAIAYGDMLFIGNSGTKQNGLFSSQDFTGPTVIGDGNDFEVATVGGLTKVVSVPNAATATVTVEVDPQAGIPTTPASTPLTLWLLAAGLLGGTSWFLVTRRRTGIA